MSGVDPGANGAMIFTLLCGQSWACAAGPEASARTAMEIRDTRFMDSPRCLLTKTA